NRVICANFTDEDFYITLTFREAPEGMEQAARAVKYFIAKLNRHRAKLGIPKVKYVKTLEQGSRSGRIHCHLVVSGKGFTAKDIADLWGRGYVDVKPLQLDETGCAGLSRYFVKEKKEGGEKAGSCRRSWSCSRNCIRPVPKTNDQKYSKRAVRSIVEDGAVEKVLRARHPDYILGSCEEFHHDENGLYYIYARMYRKDTRLNI
ncbi:MAG: hypothetical protein IJ723_02195, partial [Ruminococcus sp.]|nr:hypothetical protein [Ruminococcus sp.]